MLMKRGKFWHTRLMIHGRLYHKSLKTGNKNEAIKLEAAYRTEIVRHGFGFVDESQAPRLVEFKERFLDALRHRVTPRSLSYYTAYYDAIVRSSLANLPLHQIDKRAIDEFIEWRSKQVMAATVNHSLRTLRRALRIAKDDRLIRDVPKIRLLKGERQREYVIDDATLERIIAEARARFPNSQLQHAVPFLVETGLRTTEFVSLKKDAINFDPMGEGEMGSVFVRVGKSDKSRRRIPMSETAATAAKTMMANSQCEYVYSTDEGKHGATRHFISQQFREIRDALGLPWDACLHSCRHTFLTRLGESGVDVFTIMRLAGHSSVTVSQKYVHSTGGEESAIVKVQEAKSRRKQRREVIDLQSLLSPKE
jgi:integrase